MKWRYIAQRVLTGEIIHWDVPLDRQELSWTLSGAGSLRGTVAPQVGSMIAADGRPLLEPWSTALYAEADGVIRWGGIVYASNFVGAAWDIEATSFAGYAYGVPYTGRWSKIQVDTIDCFREIWRHMQVQPDGNLGVQIVGASASGVLLGEPAKAAYTEVEIGGEWLRKSKVKASDIIPNVTGKLASAMTKTQTFLNVATVGKFADVPLPFVVTIGTEKCRVTARSGTRFTVTRHVGDTTATAHAAGVQVRFTDGTPTRKVSAQPAEPYTLAWYEAPDCGSELDRLAQETPFDYVEEHAWSGERSISHRIRLGYPRIGRRRDDLRFMQGENITSVVTGRVSGDEFANEVLTLGSGEGTKMIHATVPGRDGRLRRPVVFSHSGINRTARATQIAREELASRRDVTELASVEVAHHPNAPLGSWQVGDDVLIQADIPWLGKVAIWHRVTAWSMLTGNRARLDLRRSDAFTYRSEINV